MEDYFIYLSIYLRYDLCITVYVLVPLIMYIVCVVVMICLLCSPFTSEVFSDLHNSSTYR